MQQQPSSRGLVWRNGLIFGGIIALIGLANVFLDWQLGAYNYTVNPATGTPTATGGSPALGCVVFLVDLALTFVAGMLTARASGSVGAASLTGLVAGLLGALVGGVIAAVLIIVVIAPQIQLPTGSGVSQSQLQSILIGVAIGAVVLGLLVDGGVGAGVAALGGLVGRNSYQQAHPPQPYQQSFYPGGQVGGQPYAPPPPPYTGAPQDPTPQYPAPQYPPQPYPGQQPPPPYAGEQPTTPEQPPTPYPGGQPPYPPQQG
ncbi:MAG TPA: hypothetical protein VF808_05595 [Ktedonobacterales bacterium]